ncbi:unnamed protein product [Calicophoron daubneyi]|uniref:Uncharacterized protein n=1 Tax=Calicophoron daubneyi TaxID=300641 RepID=A0AAV2TAA0_CALDB
MFRSQCCSSLIIVQPTRHSSVFFSTHSFRLSKIAISSSQSVSQSVRRFSRILFLSLGSKFGNFLALIFSVCTYLKYFRCLCHRLALFALFLAPPCSHHFVMTGCPWFEQTFSLLSFPSSPPPLPSHLSHPVLTVLCIMVSDLGFACDWYTLSILTPSPMVVLRPSGACMCTNFSSIRSE